jgi:hypothetical protein
VPEGPFPRENTTEQFQARLAGGPVDVEKLRARMKAELKR